MRDRLILLPGWGLGVSPLEPLAAALQGLDEHLQVQIEPLPDVESDDLQEWLDELDSTLPQDVWLGGWSLGGMLAAELAARRGDHCCGLLTFASNASFVAWSRWDHGMHEEDFIAFLNGCRLDPVATLKRFSLLCARGSSDPRSLARLLLAGAPKTSAQTLLSGLELLGRLDTRQALVDFQGPQLHLFAGLDGLVPAEVASELFALLPDVEIGLIEQAGHAFLLEDPHGVAGAIQAFLHECGDD
ncbi:MULTISPECIES: alpha/beta fold hydrolase [Pseudomonas]|jgi:pimeloyl-[acyl-carrier protein] methyl ester esterase|uniref:alpha/beta fold hydrolase n=1 Tax=Pseudomonas TaxID=286 RepID=UPI000281CACC|nr:MULTISPECIES: alpha/beta fold hydrolase [Pseudomonas]MBK5440198.1 alpha/beta fold hydrolase [Pseudomonas sp. TH32]MBT1269722.1 alpha/beta fold hydrolase [Pseudomonas sp. VS38]MDF3197887.1 alpha/beta fold hydrolase [Pseudomonas sp. 1912-s]NVZ14162.1 alpha/beta fold hydrolase [Pseudomonas sp. IPO3775]NVZ33374.1 alpha/beta fold hydrolase [Pseudomonas sp. A4002]